MPIQTNLQLRDGKNINVFTRFHLSLYLSEAHTTVTCGTMSLPINPGKVMVEPQPVSPAMTFLASKTLSPSSLPINPSPRPRVSHPITILATHTTLKSKYQAERGLEFETGDSFFRRESATGRDLGVLAASLHKKSNGSLRVLDAMCGCGVRSLRYLVEAEADFVLANDANDDYRRVVLSNLSRVGRGSGDKQRRWAATHFDANRVMTECYLQKDFFDLIDIDSFGSDSSFLRSAYNALKLGGLVYITSTDGYSSGGHRPQHSLASYGAYVRPMPYSNEVGLRMLIGGALREAWVLGYQVSPLFSCYSSHGPVFRVMLRLSRGKLHEQSSHYGFISYCHQCGHSQAFSWDQLGRVTCPCSNSKVSSSLVLSGPLWTGPLHDATYVAEMLDLAEQWGWAGNGSTTMNLEKLLKLMIDESDPKLPFGYIKMDEVASRAKVNSPPLRTMLDVIHKEGYAVSRSHIAANAIKTNCPMSDCIRIAKELRRQLSAQM
ncbi:tRNA (guanine(26)-N(2))-dimethyltransferase isoform X2 [Malania oleifera]|uniref:tRNA (guanine(26)-N(2))-dimethyltransferase isoform X2 n=1 Tax=Malania oleifera TaxID=397392 RepID=UPI0025AE436D|nr:tRNA (guanine(26)-N(2))-dimethyltransferase isoform X2 [Malania oleifera]